MFKLFQVEPEQGHAILGAMNAVLTQEGAQSLSDLEARTLRSIVRSICHIASTLKS
jgi:hypothetical protein